MMRAAMRHFVTRAAAAIILEASLPRGVVLVIERSATSLLDGALKAEYREPTASLSRSSPHRHMLRPTLESLEKDHAASLHDREVAAIVLYRDRPTAGRARFLLPAI